MEDDPKTLDQGIISEVGTWKKRSIGGCTRKLFPTLGAVFIEETYNNLKSAFSAYLISIQTHVTIHQVCT